MKMKQRYTVFEANKTGVYLSQTPQASVTLCDFDIKKMNYNPLANEIYTGIYVNSGCDGFEIEENYFYNSDSNPFSGTDSTIGMVVNNSGAVSNEVYNNYFEGLDYGISAQGTNKGDSIGLRIRCNDFDTCRYDIVVVPSGAIGIALNQGTNSNDDPENMAGNLFYIQNETPDGDYDDIDNEGQLINYYYPQNADGYGEDRLKPIDIDTNKVKLKFVNYIGNWTFDEGCPSCLNQGGIIEGLRSEMLSFEHKIDSIENVLNLLIDGGETDELQSDVEFSAPPESMDIYTELMSESPYLSDTVISTAIEKENVLPNAMIRDVMIANPNTAKTNKLLDKLDERFNPMPGYMKAQILQGRSILSIREETEAELMHLKGEKARIYNTMLRYYRRDTLSPQASNDSILLMYKNENTLNDKYALVLEYLNRNDTTNAILTLNWIPTAFDLTINQTSSHQVFKDYFEILLEIASEGKTVYQADSTDKVLFYSLYENSTGKTNALIRNLLMVIDTLNYEEPYFFPDLLKSAQIDNNWLDYLNNNKSKYLKIYPNPAMDYLIIDCINDSDSEGVVSILNLSGILIKSIKGLKKHNQLIVDIRSWKPGLYIATLTTNSERVESIKFSIIK